MNGSALSVNWASENANAILDAWYSGEEGGTAIAQTLAGVNNPAGRLPVTFYKGVEQLPPFEDYAMKNRTYRYFEGQPLYPFGYGLSYSKFEYSNLKLSSTTVNAGDGLSVDADVKNTALRGGDEVVQVYVTFPKSSTAPLRALRGFTRVHLRGGQTEHVSFKLDARDLSAVNQSGDRVVAAGSYRISVGGGQPGTGAPQAEADFAVSSEQRLPE
jgi:beta-glucosidase